MPTASQPYTSTNQVTAGATQSFTENFVFGTVASAPATTKQGDRLTITFNEPFKNLVDITSFVPESWSQSQSFDVNGNQLENAIDGWKVRMRWSGDNKTWSPFWPVPQIGGQNASGQNIENYDITAMQSATDLWKPATDTYLEFEFVRQVYQPTLQNPNQTQVKLLEIDLSWQSVPAGTTGGNAAPTATACVAGGNHNGIRVDCEGGLFKVYDLMNPAIALNRELALAVSEMFGHQVCYFKTTADQKSKDFILKEYSLYNVTDVKNVRIVVPDNVFPDNAIMYTPFDMDFESPFEVQIVKEDFERAFGYCVRPEERDYLYFPLENRMYEIQSAYLYKDFMRDGVYYKVNLFKWQDKDNVMRTPGSTAATYVDQLTENFDDVFKVEDEKEFTQITKPLQYNTINVGDWDFVRSLINEKLDIKKHDINNYFTIVAKYAYDLRSIGYNDLGIQYKQKVAIGATDDRVYTFWFRTDRNVWENLPGATYINEYPVGNALYPNQYDTLIYGGYTASTGPTSNLQGNGMELNLVYGPKTSPTGASQTVAMEVLINNQQLHFGTNQNTNWPNNGFPNLVVDAKQYNQKSLIDSRKWYAGVFTINNTHSAYSLDIWEMMFDATKPAYTQQTTNLRNIFSQSISFSSATMINSDPATNDPVIINNGDYYQLLGWPGEITNIRILKEPINIEQQPLMLNRYTVRDNQYAEMIDNALPPLNMTRESGR